MPGNVFPKPSELADVVRLVEPFLSLSDLTEPEWGFSRYMLKAEVR